MIKNKAIAMSTFAAILGLGASTALASSHREAPAIAEDPCADNTDVYAFISPENPNNLVVVANYIPLLIPSSGPNFYSFCDDVAYDIKFDNNGDAKTDITYRFLFSTKVQNGKTFLYNTGVVDSLQSPNLNVRKFMDVIRLDRRGRVEDAIAADIPVAPWFVGDKSFPGNNYNATALAANFTNQASNVRIFAGPRDEAFFVDLNVFDLLDVGRAVPSTNNLNVMSLVLEVPITDIAAKGTRPTDANSKEAIIGVHATASRARKRVLHKNGEYRERGQFVQVSRLAIPLVNEVLVPLQDKDKFNRSQPQEDVANIGAYILDPEVPKLLTGVLGLGCPATPAGGRTDLVGILSPNGTTAADLLRINIAQGKDFDNSTAFPNGRKIDEDVTDTLLTVLCNKPDGAGGLTPIGDGVNANDKLSTLTFPYMPAPLSGNVRP